MKTENNAQHTPGKITGGGWKVTPHPVLKGRHPFHDSRFIVTNDAVFEVDPNDEENWTLRNGVIVAELKDSERQVSNARLIAAAPDLLAALKALEGYTDVFTEHYGRTSRATDVLNAARAAIAKAEGEK